MLAAMNPNPKLFDVVNPIELNGGQGAERLADRLGITREAMDRWALESHRRAIAARERLREEIVPMDGLDLDGQRDDGARRSGAARRHDLREDRRARAGLSRRRQDHRGHLVGTGRRRGRLHADVGRRGEAPAQPRAARAHPHHRRRRVRADRPHLLGRARDAARARAFEAPHRRHGGRRSERGVRLRAARAHARARHRATRAASIRTAARARSGIRSARRARGSSGRRRWSCGGAAGATASPRSAAAWARATTILERI